MTRVGRVLLPAAELLFYLGASLLLCWVAWPEVELRWTLERHGRPAEAKVVGHRGQSGRSGVYFRPEVLFVTEAGRQVRAVAEGKGEPSTSPWPRGTTLAILYDPAAPARVMPAAELERVGWLPVMLLGGGAALLMLGLFAFRLRARLGPRADSRPTRGADRERAPR